MLEINERKGGMELEAFNKLTKKQQMALTEQINKLYTKVEKLFYKVNKLGNYFPEEKYYSADLDKVKKLVGKLDKLPEYQYDLDDRKVNNHTWQKHVFLLKVRPALNRWVETGTPIDASDELEFHFLSFALVNRPRKFQKNLIHTIADEMERVTKFDIPYLKYLIGKYKNSFLVKYNLTTQEAELISKLLITEIAGIYYRDFEKRATWEITIICEQIMILLRKEGSDYYSVAERLIEHKELLDRLNLEGDKLNWNLLNLGK